MRLLRRLRAALAGLTPGAGRLGKREQVAALALAGLASCQFPQTDDQAALLARAAVELVDRLLDELGR
jgi:hypothetical protein